MIALFLFPLILAYSPAAVWALRAGGQRRLWLVCAFALGSIVLVALTLSAVYSVPSAWRVVLYLLALLAPSILLATGSLAIAGDFISALSGQLITSLSGSLIGLVVGLGVVVYGLGVW